MNKNFRNIVNIIVAIVASCLSLLLQSCENTYTYTKEQAKVEKFLSERKFDKAREIAMSIPADEYYYNHEEDRRIYYRSQMIRKINKAQLSILIADDLWYDAQSLAQELNAEDEFNELFRTNLNRLLRTQNYNLIFNILATQTIKAQFFPTVSDEYYTRPGHINAGQGNYEYNEEVAAYNNAVDAYINALIIEGNKTMIKKCLSLYKDEAVKISGDDFGTSKYVLKNNARKRAMEKINREGINL